MPLSDWTIQQRLATIPDPIREIGRENIIVRNMIDRYVHGDIMTLEEALCQMVRLLADDWQRQMDGLVKAAKQMPSSFIVPERKC